MLRWGLAWYTLASVHIFAQTQETQQSAASRCWGGIGIDWDPNETGWAKLLAQLVFKEKSGGCTAQEKFGIKEAPDCRMGEPADVREGLQEARAGPQGPGEHKRRKLQSAASRCWTSRQGFFD